MRPSVNAPFILDFELGEQALHIQWINNKTIYRQVFGVPGGNNKSSIPTNLHITMDTLINGYWAGCLDGDEWFINARTQDSEITISLITGLLMLRHSSKNLTGKLIFCVLEYTKK